MLIKWRKMNLRIVSRAQFSKLRNEINDTIQYVAKISYQSDNCMEIVKVGTNILHRYTQTHTCTRSRRSARARTHTHAQTHTHTTHTTHNTHSHTHSLTHSLTFSLTHSLTPYSKSKIIEQLLTPTILFPTRTLNHHNQPHSNIKSPRTLLVQRPYDATDQVQHQH